MLFFHHDQLCVSFLPPRPHDTHTLFFDWHFALMIPTSPQSVCQPFTGARKLLYSLFYLSRRVDISICPVLCCSFSERCAKKCITMTNDNYWNTGAHIHIRTCRGAGDVLDNRMCGGNFTGLSHAFRIAPQPYCFLHHSGVYICVCVCVSKTMGFVCSGKHPEQ